MRTAYLETLYNLAESDKNVYAVISDNGAIVYDKYRQDFPEQFINAGIAEANMVAMAAGMAERGKIPFAYTIGAFLAYRAYEFILNDVCMMNKNVKLVGIGEGCSYSLLGASHHTIFDLAVLRPLPNLTILSPASPMEVKKCVKAAYEITGPVYIRLGTNHENEVYESDYDFVVGAGIELKGGEDIALISTGSIVYDVLCVAKELEGLGIYARVINIPTVKPINEDIIIKACKETKAIITVEEHSIIGGIGSAVSEIIAERKLQVLFFRLGLNSFVQGYGLHEELKELNGIGRESIKSTVIKMVKNEL